ncbi:MAG TPA: hypothetical protein VEX68_11410, partial [Bryobacteraceae bacterium]|nr:hypothetical protein [Bryobacteraceae bacterium]
QICPETPLGSAIFRDCGGCDTQIPAAIGKQGRFDLDFSTIQTTLDFGDRNQFGTTGTTTFDVLLQQFLLIEGELAVEHQR